MTRPFQEIVVERKGGGDVFCVRLRHPHMEEPEILVFTEEVLSLISADNCRKLVLSLGPGDLTCLYSVFLAKLVMLRRQLLEKGGKLKICEASPATVGVFEACHLKDYFEFYPEQDLAIASFE
jgi:anti-anti-sigma factor